MRYYGDPKRECRCSPREIKNYRNRISGPLLDRIDLHVEAPAVEYKGLSSTESAELSAAIRSRVIEARLLIEHWRSQDYNQIRPHSSLGRIPPNLFALNYLNQTPNNPEILHPALA